MIRTNNEDNSYSTYNQYGNLIDGNIGYILYYEDGRRWYEHESSLSDVRAINIWNGLQFEEWFLIDGYTYYSTGEVNIYGYIVGRWPSESMAMRNDAILMLAKTKWFEEGINRGARSVPIGFNQDKNSVHQEMHDYNITGFETPLLKEIMASALGQNSFLQVFNKK